jgi:hypothetical protein
MIVYDNNGERAIQPTDLTRKDRRRLRTKKPPPKPAPKQTSAGRSEHDQEHLVEVQNRMVTAP